MTRNLVSPRSSRQGGVIRATPCSSAEEQFIERMAHALSYATALVASNPDNSWERRSLAARISESYRRYLPERHPEFRERVREHLAAPLEARRRLFGEFAERSASEDRSGPKIDDERMKTLLRSAVTSRLDLRRDYLISALTKGSLADPKKGDWELTKTWLEAGYFSGDIQVAMQSPIHVGHPYVMGFRWGTDEIEAETGVWRLTQLGGQGAQQLLLADGTAGDAPGGKFKIDLTKYLPAEVPSVPAVYLVEVLPATKMKYQPGATAGMPGKKVLGKIVGPASNAIVIAYSAAYEPPPPDLTVYKVFRWAELNIGTLTMVSESTEPGAEEFYVHGFVQESFSGKSSKTGKQIGNLGGYAELDPDGPTSAPIGGLGYFHLNNPDSDEWPRAYTLVMSILEEDGGSNLDEWLAAVQTVAGEFLSGEIGAAISDYLSDLVDKYLSEDFEELLKYSDEIASLAQQFAVEVGDILAGMIVAVVATVVISLILGMEDDYYGTECAVLVLPSNVQEVVIDSVPGYWSGDAPGYHLETEPLVFLGPAEWNSASPADGYVELSFSWTLSGLEDW